jgi:hypothetical protein
MTKFEEVRPYLEKALKAIHEDRSKLKYAISWRHKQYGSSTEITARRLEAAASNHLFDDRYELLGISEIEGHRIRDYFSSHRDFQFVEDLYTNFPYIMDPEDKLYIEMTVNKERTRLGLNPFNNIPLYDPSSSQ